MWGVVESIWAPAWRHAMDRPHASHAFQMRAGAIHARPNSMGAHSRSSRSDPDQSIETVRVWVPTPANALQRSIDRSIEGKGKYASV